MQKLWNLRNSTGDTNLEALRNLLTLYAFTTGVEYGSQLLDLTGFDGINSPFKNSYQTWLAASPYNTLYMLSMDAGVAKGLLTINLDTKAITSTGILVAANTRGMLLQEDRLYLINNANIQIFSLPDHTALPVMSGSASDNTANFASFDDRYYVTVDSAGFRLRSKTNFSLMKTYVLPVGYETYTFRRVQQDMRTGYLWLQCDNGIAYKILVYDLYTATIIDMIPSSAYYVKHQFAVDNYNYRGVLETNILSGVGGNIITVAYDIKDYENTTHQLIPEFSVDAGVTYTPATITAGNLTGLVSGFEIPVSHSFSWAYSVDVPGGGEARLKTKIKQEVP